MQRSHYRYANITKTYHSCQFLPGWSSFTVTSRKQKRRRIDTKECALREREAVLKMTISWYIVRGSIIVLWLNIALGTICYNNIRLVFTFAIKKSLTIHSINQSRIWDIIQDLFINSVAKIKVCAFFHSRVIRRIFIDPLPRGTQMEILIMGRQDPTNDNNARYLNSTASEICASRVKQLVSFLNLFQYYSDSNDAESWMKEKMYVVSSEDYGRDEQSAMVGRKSSVITFCKRSSLTRE